MRESAVFLISIKFSKHVGLCIKERNLTSFNFLIETWVNARKFNTRTYNKSNVYWERNSVDQKTVQLAEYANGVNFMNRT